MLAISRARPCTSTPSTSTLWHVGQQPCRSISNSPYGRTHVWKRRAPKLPHPLVPKFPQKVVRSDGTSFTHWTTSPISLIRLTRDTTNNPNWNTGNPGDRSFEEENTTTGRLGRFSRKFADLGADLDDTQWMQEMTTVMKPEIIKQQDRPKAKKGKK